MKIDQLLQRGLDLPAQQEPPGTKLIDPLVRTQVRLHHSALGDPNLGESTPAVLLGTLQSSVLVLHKLSQPFY